MIMSRIQIHILQCMSCIFGKPKQFAVGSSSIASNLHNVITIHCCSSMINIMMMLISNTYWEKSCRIQKAKMQHWLEPFGGRFFSNLIFQYIALGKGWFLFLVKMSNFFFFLHIRVVDMEMYPGLDELQLLTYFDQQFFYGTKSFLRVWVCKIFHEIFFRSHSWLENFHPKCILYQTIRYQFHNA